MTAVLLLCPHNAAKSVVAAAYLEREARSHGLDLRIDTAGTEPDAEVFGFIRDHLVEQNLPVDEPPRHVVAADLNAADLIINMGCDHADLPTEKSITDWAIPNFSDDKPAAFAALELHIGQLVSELTATTRRR